MAYLPTTSTAQRASEVLVTQYQGMHALRHCLCGVAATLLLSACATTPLSPTQRQQLETRVYSASYERTFAAARDAFVNASYVIEDSDYDGGIMHVSTRVLGKNPNVALGWSILVTPVGDGYNGRWGWAVFDTLFWPFSIVWAAPSKYLIAKGSSQNLEGNLSFEELSEERTRLRVSLRGVPHDAESYPRRVRGFQEEIERQLFVKGGDTLAGEPQ